jgi:hypothetical protein
MPLSPTPHGDLEPCGSDAQLPAAHNAAIEPASSALASALERRISELSEQLHAMTTERSILAGELRLMRAGQKSAAEITATLAMRRISM